MSERKKIYQALSFLIDKQTRSSSFKLDALTKEYHVLRDGDIIIMLSYEWEDDAYEISTINIADRWIDLDLLTLMSTSGSSDYDLMWRHLTYFGITPDKIYELYSNDTFEYCPKYEIDEEEEE
jgi:nuclear transport factor 2 (NTF2) superfamily protein